jgi:hypothetical protein
MNEFIAELWDWDVERVVLSLAPGGFWQGRHYYAHCPLHDDHDWSFGFEKDDRRWRCHSGCGGGDLVALGVRLWNCGTDTVVARIDEILGPEKKQFVRSYPYIGADGKLLYEVRRYRPKGFDWRKPAEWLWLDDLATHSVVPQIPYRLPEVLAAKDVFIVEGEKDCETARDLALVATCNPRGAGKWRSEFVEIFSGKRVQIIADSDEFGRQHAMRVAGSLVSVAESVKLIELARCKDLTMWVEYGGTRQQLLDLFEAVPALTPEDVVGWWDPNAIEFSLCGEFLLEPTWLPEEPKQVATSEDQDQTHRDSPDWLTVKD